VRTDIAERRMEIESWIEENQSKAFMCRQLRCKPETLEFWLARLNLHYSGNRGAKGVKTSNFRLSALEYARTNNPRPHILRLKLLEDGHPHRCDTCGGSVWNGEPTPLELHHVDGNHWNNTMQNLAILCPNCHAQTPNHAGKGRKRKTVL
jgi:hypothetical protein